MDAAAARAHLEARIAKLDNTYHASWPRWTYADLVAVSALLHPAVVVPVATPPCAECGQAPARYTRGGLDITVPGHGVCRLCHYNCSGDSPDDLAEHDARSEEEYTVLREQYIAELLAADHPHRDAMIRYYAQRGLPWATAALHATPPPTEA